MSNIERLNFQEITKADRLYSIERNGRFPLDIDSVKRSKEELNKYLDISDAYGGNVYPGMLIAIDDDLTYHGENASNNERGIYWILRDRNNKNKFKSYCLAYTDQIPTKQAGISSTGEDYVYSVGKPDSTKTVLSAYGWIYEHNPWGFDGTQNLCIAFWGADRNNIGNNYMQLRLPQTNIDENKTYHSGLVGIDLAMRLNNVIINQNDNIKDSVEILYPASFYNDTKNKFTLRPSTKDEAGIVGTDLALNLDNFYIYQDITTDDSVTIRYRKSFWDGMTDSTFDLRPAGAGGTAGIIPKDMAINLDNNYISQFTDTGNNTYLMFKYRSSFYNDCSWGTFKIKTATQDYIGLMSPSDKHTVDATYTFLNKFYENETVWDELTEDDGIEVTTNKPVLNTSNILSEAQNDLMYEITPIYKTTSVDEVDASESF